MPLLRSRHEVRRATFRVFIGFYIVMAIWTLVFAAIVAEHYFIGWW